MTQFKVGDRVRYIHDGDEGTVTELTSSFGEDRARVDFERDGIWTVCTNDIELVERQPNRTYYETENTFEQNVRRILGGVADTVVQKNLAYGDSALNPIRVFSKADRMEQLYIRLDDKLSRVQRGHEYPGDDTLRDIIGYATLILIARESQ